MTPTPFAGLAGETVRLFIRPRTFWTLIPALFAALVLGFLAGLLSGALSLPAPLVYVVAIVAIAPVTGRYALSAMAGNLDAGFFTGGYSSGAVMRFSGRYATATLIWGIPFSILAASLGSNLLSFFGGVSSFKGLMIALVGFATVVLAVFGPTLALMVALSAESNGETLHPARWLWLLTQGRGDLTVLFTSCIGGGLVFCAFLLPLLLVFTLIAIATDPVVGAAVGAISYAMPAAAGLVLMARLAGAACSDMNSAQSSDAAAASGLPAGGDSSADAPIPIRVDTAAIKSAVASGAPPTIAPAPRTVFRELQEVEALADQDPAAALAQARAIAEKNPTAAGATALVARLMVANGDVQQGMAEAARAIEKALNTGATPLAVDTFIAVSDHRKSLRLSPAAFERLAKALMHKSDFDRSVWCFRAAAALGGDVTRMQKGVIAVADAAAAAGDNKKALLLYDFIAQKHPGTPSAEYANQAAQVLRAHS